MSKKKISFLTSLLAILSLSVFSITNAFALEADEATSGPLTSPIQICIDSTLSLKHDIAAAKAKGLSAQLTPEEIEQMVKDIKAAQKKACKEARALTTPVTICKNLKASLNANIVAAKAKGLSLQLTPEEIEQMIKDIKAAVKQTCKEAKALTTPVTICKSLKASLDADIAAAKAKGLSSQLSEEEIAQMVKDIKAAKKKACNEAKVYKKIAKSK